MKSFWNLPYTIVTLVILTLSSCAATNPFRKRSSNADVISISEEREFGRFLEDEMFLSNSMLYSYSFSYSLSYNWYDDIGVWDDDDISVPSVITQVPNVPTATPTQFIDLTSNDNSVTPSQSPSGHDSEPNGSLINATAEDSTGAVDPNVNFGTGTSSSSGSNASRSQNYTQFILIPVLGVVFGGFIAGLAVRAIDRRNGPIEYHNLDQASSSSFSYEA